MDRCKFLSALPFLHILENSNTEGVLEEAFPTLSDKPTNIKSHRGSNVTQAVPSASGIRCGVSIETTSRHPTTEDITAPIFFHHPPSDGGANSTSFDDAATCIFRALVLRPGKEAAKKAVKTSRATGSSVASSQKQASPTPFPPTAPILVFTFTSSSHPYMVSPHLIKRVILSKPTPTCPPSLAFVFETVLLRAYEILETYMTPGDDLQESMEQSYERLSISYKEITSMIELQGKEGEGARTLTVNQTRCLVTEGRFVAGSKQESPETSVCSNKLGAQGQESEKLTDDVVAADGVANRGSSDSQQVPSSVDSTGISGKGDTDVSDVMLRQEVLLEKAEKLAPAAKKRRMAREYANRLITRALAPKTVPSNNIVEATRFLEEGQNYLKRLGSLSSASEADGQVPSLIPNTELSNQLDRCAEEIRKIYAPLSEEDALEAKEINEGVDKAKENLDLMIRKVYKVGGKGGKKRKSLEGEGGEWTGDAGDRGPREEDVKKAFQDIIVGTRARNLLLWG